ncbi:MAG: hypothetical protein ACI4VK_00080 [Candidatus Coproplasma sp.]
MADNMNGSRTKADLIVDRIAAIDGEIAGVEKKVSGLVSAIDESKALISANSKASAAGIEQLKTEINFVSAQLESVCVMLTKSVSKLADEVAELKKKQQPDLDELASLIAAKIVIPEAESAVEPEKLDYDALGYAVAKSIYVPQAVAEEIDYEDLATKIAEKLPTPEIVVPQAEPVREEVNYDLIAAKVAQAVNIEPVSADRIAAMVAEQIVVPAAENTVTQIDTDEIVNRLSDRMSSNMAASAADAASYYVQEQPAQHVEIDTDAVADEVVSRLASAITESLNPDDIADCVAKRVGSVSPEDFEITVDDDGCSSIAKAIEEKLDYEALAAKVSERISPSYASMSIGESVDAEEVAAAITDKLTVNAAIDEDALAEKAASILSNYMPEVDHADIADKVIAGIIPAIPAPVATDPSAIIDEVLTRVAENQNDSDYEIVIDDEGVAQITESMKGELTRISEEHYEKVESDLAAVKEEYSARFDKVDEDIEEIKKLLAAGAIVVAAADDDETAVTEDELVTVSDVVGEEQEETAQDEVIDEIVSDIEETPTEGEMLPDGMDDESEGGVDFANMMKYNRSFIARIIQGTDEQKNYYGQVKTALLSYRKVNSNIAWGAERFNKGRETIARFKIRGKTLCLYLALDPSEFETSVYHHVDVSDNKSMHGTPMMVKIKSPRGVKKAIRLIDIMLERRDGIKRNVAERDYAAMYPYETIEELIEDGLVKDVSKK